MPEGPVVGSRVSKRPRRQALSSTAQRKNLEEVIRSSNREMPFPCTRCSRLSRRCLVGRESVRCAECLRANYGECDIGLSKVQWERLEKVRSDLRQRLQEVEDAEMKARVEARRVRKELSLVDSRQQEMVEKEMALIESLEALEKAEAEKNATPAAKPSSANVSTEDSEAVVWQNGADPVLEWKPGVPVSSSGATVVRSEVSEESVAPFSPSKRFPESRMASEEIAAFDAFAAKMFPLPGLLDPDIVS